MAQSVILERELPGRPKVSRPGWTGFLSTFDNQIKSFYREPQALAFTLGQPLILLLILDAFNFKVMIDGVERPYLDRLLPGMIAFSGMGVGLNSIIFALPRYKERGVLRRVRATPLPTISFLGGVILSRLVIALGVTLITYFSGVWLFGAELHGNLLLLIAVAELGAAVFITVGLVMVTFSKSEDDMAPMFILVLMPSLLFSGAFLPRDGLPNWLEAITDVLPLTYLTHAIQEIANLGGGLSDIRTDIIGLTAWGIGATVYTAWRFKMT